LPLTEKPKDRTRAFERLKPADRRRIVIVDDNLDAAESLAEFLTDAGHEVKVAYDGPSSLEAIRSHTPNVVILDIGLPRLDGYEVARQLRREHGDTITLVALTGYGQDGPLEVPRSDLLQEELLSAALRQAFEASEPGGGIGSPPW
jgi:CheY-like chemotaxis protein